jgi:hypothetical protein
MFDLSDELLPGQAHRGGLSQSNRPRNTVPPLILQGVKAVRSPFLFDKPTARKALSRPGTGKVLASTAQRPTTSGASGLRPGTRSARSHGNNNKQQQGEEETTRPLAATAPQLHSTVQVVQEVSVPALIITTAAVQRTSPNAKNRKHRPYNSHNDQETTQLTPSAEPVAPEEEPVKVYALHRPLSAQQSPTARTAPKSHRTVFNRQALTEHKKPTSPQGLTAAADPTQLPSSHTQLTPETRRIEGKKSPSQQPQPLRQPGEETAAAAEAATERTLTARSHVHKVTIAQEFPAGSLPGLPLTPSGFAPSRTLRPSKILCAAMLTPAERQKLDLAQMAHEAQKICKDPDFVPTVRPVHNLGSTAHNALRDSDADTAQGAPSRSQRYEMLRDYCSIPRAPKMADSRPT